MFVGVSKDEISLNVNCLNKWTPDTLYGGSKWKVVFGSFSISPNAKTKSMFQCSLKLLALYRYGVYFLYMNVSKISPASFQIILNHTIHPLHLSLGLTVHSFSFCSNIFVPDPHVSTLELSAYSSEMFQSTLPSRYYNHVFSKFIMNNL